MNIVAHPYQEIPIATAFSDYPREKNSRRKRRSWKTERFRTSHSSSNDLHRAEFDHAWLARTLATFDNKDREEQWKIAKDYRDYLEQHCEPAVAAERYFEHFADFPHDKFKRSVRQEGKEAAKAMEPGKWGYKLTTKVPELFIYSLSMKNLGLPDSYADSRFIYYSVVIEEIKAALKKLIPLPFKWKIEVGKAGNVHPHVVGPFSPALAYLNGSERMKPIKPGTEVEAFRYMGKPVATWDKSRYAEFLQARAENQGSRLSPLSGDYGLGNSRTA